MTLEDTGKYLSKYYVVRAMIQ